MAHRPQVVLIGMGMPRFDGWEVARRLRTEAGLENALFVATGGSWSEDDRRGSAEADIRHHLAKPIDLKGLLEIIEE
jgi:CheY-like chemotaxis protein